MGSFQFLNKILIHEASHESKRSIKDRAVQSGKICCQVESKQMFEYIVEGVLMFSIACVGVVGNIMAICVFATKKQHTFYR